jgi:hypothetical protein
MRALTTIIIILVFLIGCSEIKTTDPIESYKYWAGANPTRDINAVKGVYWQSAHWTREYVLYLQLKPTDTWWNEFVKQNHLQIDSKDWTMPSDAPDWFQPSDKATIYKSADSFNSSRYFKNERTGEYYIYEMQL